MINIVNVNKIKYLGSSYSYEVFYDDGMILYVQENNVYLSEWLNNNQPVEIILEI